MIRRSFVFILFVLLGLGAAANAQSSKIEPEKGNAVRTWTFSSDEGYLGVQTEEVTKANISKFGLREVRGVGVESVVDGSPAQAAGLQKGDVIARVNGDEVTSGRKLSRLISEISPDHQARLTVLRNGSEREITVTVGKRPMPKFGEGGFFEFNGPAGKFEMPQMPEMPYLDKLPKMDITPTLPPGEPGEPLNFYFGSRRQIGIGMSILTKQLASHFGVDSGALVNDVRENSPAAKAGIKAGDIIVEADGKKVDDNSGLARAIGGKKEGSVTLTIVRGGSRQTVNVTPEEMKGGENNFFQFAVPGAQDAPPAPGMFRMTRPATPGTPLPLNQLLVPGRII